MILKPLASVYADIPPADTCTTEDLATPVSANAQGVLRNKKANNK